MTPAVVEEAVERYYGNRYRLVESYGSEPTHRCFATFDVIGTNRHVTIGIAPPTWRPFLMLSRA